MNQDENEKQMMFGMNEYEDSEGAKDRLIHLFHSEELASFRFKSMSLN